MKPLNEHNPTITKDFPIGSWAMHGDVILYREPSLPSDFDSMVESKDDCLAYGEASGHAHKLFGNDGDFILRECPKTQVKYLRVINPIMLKHQEHEPRSVPPGDYRIGIQREYDPFEKLTRQVAD